MRERLISILTTLSKPSVAIGGSLALAAVIIGATWYMATSVPPSTFVPVTRGAITEEVDVSGTVKAAHSTDLAFQTSGRVASILVQVGDHVTAGQTLVVLDGSTQAAAVNLAKANLAVAQAKLDSLTAGTRPEQLSIDQTAVTQAKSALASALASAYANADDAVHAKADQVFTNPRNAAAELVPLVPDATLVNEVQTERVALEPLLLSWQSALAAASDPESVAASSEANMRSVVTFLDNLAMALAEAQPNGTVPAATLTGYQTTVNTGRSNVATALSALIAADTAYKSATGALVLAQAGATENDVNAQKAAVAAAAASLDAAQAAAAQTIIAAPVSGTITVQSADLGETVVPGVPLVSIIADGKYEATAQVSDVDIAKVHLNDAVDVTSAAYPDTTFKAVVTTIDPAASVTGGVASYGVTVTFLDNDPRLKPGLSANLHVITATKDSALLVPTSAIITDGDQTFVYRKAVSGTLRTPVTVGIESTSGMTEVTSGLSEGDSVLAFGSYAAP